MIQPRQIHYAYRIEWDRLTNALMWRYGAERTKAILAAQDEPTNTDLKAWRSLGERGRTV